MRDPTPEEQEAEEERLSRGGPPPKCNGTNGVAGVDCIPPNRVRDGPPTVRPAGALAQEDPKAAAKKGDEAAEENNSKDEEGAKELKEYRENGGPPPICNGTNGAPGVDCRRPSGPPGHERVHKNGMHVPDLTPAKATPAPSQGEGPVPG